MKVSACIVIKNEGKLLSRCLSSIKDAVDEIILVHDGPCSDNSLEIAKKYKAKIFIRPIVGVAEPHRPFSYTKASGDWILQIDADEYLSERAQKELPKLILEKNIDAYSFAWPYPRKGKYIQRGPFSKTVKNCLFRKSKLYMIGIAQEYPRTYGILQKRLDILLEHKPVDDNFTWKIFQEKWLLWAKLQARQIYNIEKAPLFNVSNILENKTIQHYIFVRKHPVLSGITEIAKFIGIYTVRGILYSGIDSIKIAVLEIIYILSVRMYLGRIH